MSSLWSEWTDRYWSAQAVCYWSTQTDKSWWFINVSSYLLISTVCAYIFMRIQHRVRSPLVEEYKEEQALGLHPDISDDAPELNYCPRDSPTKLLSTALRVILVRVIVVIPVMMKVEAELVQRSEGWLPFCSRSRFPWMCHFTTYCFLFMPTYCMLQIMRKAEHRMFFKRAFSEFMLYKNLIRLQEYGNAEKNQFCELCRLWFYYPLTWLSWSFVFFAMANLAWVVADMGPAFHTPTALYFKSSVFVPLMGFLLLMYVMSTMEGVLQPISSFLAKGSGWMAEFFSQCNEFEEWQIEQAVLKDAKNDRIARVISFDDVEDNLMDSNAKYSMKEYIERITRLARMQIPTKQTMWERICNPFWPRVMVLDRRLLGHRSVMTQDRFRFFRYMRLMFSFCLVASFLFRVGLNCGGICDMERTQRIDRVVQFRENLLKSVQITNRHIQAFSEIRTPKDGKIDHKEFERLMGHRGSDANILANKLIDDLSKFDNGVKTSVGELRMLSDEIFGDAAPGARRSFAVFSTLVSAFFFMWAS